LNFEAATECRGGACYAAALPPAPATTRAPDPKPDDADEALDPNHIYAARERAAAEAARNRGQTPQSPDEGDILTPAGAAGVYAQRATKGVHHEAIED
jgi:hypothetical protein